MIDEKRPEDHSPVDTLRHSAAHIMASAVKKLFPEAQVTIGPAIEHGFYYDFAVPRPFTNEDLQRIEAEMKKIIDADLPFVREEITREDAIRLFESMGEKFKVDIISSIPAGQIITLFRHGDFVDLCRGPHIARTSELRAFKLLSVAGAYWRGDERNPMLSRIYGTAFLTEKDLAEHLNFLEEAKKRDHRKIGKELGLFSFDDDIGPGLVLWHPKGSLIRYVIEERLRQKLLASGYDLVYTPHVAREELWRTSGHLDKYDDLMFGSMEVEGRPFRVKPMNCPFHVAIFRTGLRSYRELPIRYAELGTVYRFERSGVLHGALRVRGFTQDDAHLFCKPEDLEREIDGVLTFGREVLGWFGFTEFKLFLATRPEKFIGDPDRWTHAENALRAALERSGLSWHMDAGGGAFYGPKIDLKIKDAIGREWQLSTFQVDFNFPERFELEYVASDGTRQRPLMIHRALLGSLERFVAILTEHYAGAFPLWLAPVQARVLTVTERADAFAQEAVGAMRKLGLRVDVDLRNEKLGAKIRDAQMAKVPYMLVVGDKEVAARALAPRTRDGKSEGPVALDTWIERLLTETRAVFNAA